MNYSELTDFEINKIVAERLGHTNIIKTTICPPIDHGATLQVHLRDGGVMRVDYCNNPSDAWPIILENDIGFINGKSNPRAFRNGNTRLYRSVSSVFYQKDGSHLINPLRAAMIVYLMMGDE